MAVKDAIAKAWGLPARLDGLRYSLPDVTAPPTPANPSATTFDDESIDIDCDASVDPGSAVVSYRIYGGTAEGGPYDFIAAISHAQFPYRVSNLIDETEYFFKITAVNSFGLETALGSCTEVSDTTGAGSGGTGAYVATHFVAPFAEVSGAANDYADLGATSWTNAANSGTPTTLGTWKARATAGTYTRTAPGQYTGQVSGSRFVGAFVPVNSGTEANPIVLFAQYPAATNIGSTSLYSELRRPAAISGGGSIGPIIAAGQAGQHDIIYDGFYFDETVSAAGPSEGMAQFAGGALRCKMRRLLFNRGNMPPQYGSGYNGNCVYWEITEDCVMEDCYFYGVSGNTSNQNNGAVELYNSINPRLRFNTLLDVGWALHVKTEAPVGQIGVEWHMEDVHLHNNHIRSYAGINSQTSRSTYAYDNLIEITASGYTAFRWSNTAANNFIPCAFSAYRNTVIASGSAGGAIIWHGASNMGAGSEWHSNLIQITGAGSAYLVQMPEDGAAWPGGVYGDLSDADVFDYNFYVEASPRWQIGGAPVRTALANWQSDCAGFGDYESNSQLGSVTFIDAGAGNYRLVSNGQAALTAGQGGTSAGCDFTEGVGVRALPPY